MFPVHVCHWCTAVQCATMWSEPSVLYTKNATICKYIKHRCIDCLCCYVNMSCNWMYRYKICGGPRIRCSVCQCHTRPCNIFINCHHDIFVLLKTSVCLIIFLRKVHPHTKVAAWSVWKILPVMVQNPCQIISHESVPEHHKLYLCLFLTFNSLLRILVLWYFTDRCFWEIQNNYDPRFECSRVTKYKCKKI